MSRSERTKGRAGEAEASAAAEIMVGRVLAELEEACERFPPMHSPHEGIAVIHEEFRELRRHVYGDSGRSTAARIEAIQLAAMATRYALDLCGRSDDE